MVRNGIGVVGDRELVQKEEVVSVDMPISGGSERSLNRWKLIADPWYFDRGVPRVDSLKRRGIS